MSGVGGIGRPLAAQKILQSLCPPLSFTTLSRSPFTVPGEYHHFPTSDGVSAGNAPPNDTIEEGWSYGHR